MPQPLRARKTYPGAPYQTPGTVPPGAPYGTPATPTRQPEPTAFPAGTEAPFPGSPGPRPTGAGPYDFNIGVAGQPGQQPGRQPTRQPTIRPGRRLVSTMPMSPTGATETTSWQPPSGPAPTFEAPEYDEREIRKLTQRYAAAPTRRLRETIRRIAGQAYGSPMVKRMTLREALEGYGTALESVMAGAGRAATGEYAGRYAREFQAAQIGFQALYNQWMQEGQRVSRKQYTYEMPEGATAQASYGQPPDTSNYYKVRTQAGHFKWVKRGER